MMRALNTFEMIVSTILCSATAQKNHLHICCHENQKCIKIFLGDKPCENGTILHFRDPSSGNDDGGREDL
jgi:hypothetical protein